MDFKVLWIIKKINILEEEKKINVCLRKLLQVQKFLVVFKMIYDFK